MRTCFIDCATHTLLEDDRNTAPDNKRFKEKKLMYSTSQYVMTKQIMANDWTPNTLDNRQRKLADYATAAWRLPNFDKE
jgi:hypothetical protein